MLDVLTKRIRFATDNIRLLNDEVFACFALFEALRPGLQFFST